MNTQRQRRVGPEVQTRHQKTPPVNIDPQAFWEAVQRKTEDINLYQLADALEISSSTFTRLRYAAEGIDPKYRPNLATYLTLCQWMGYSPAMFITGPKPVELRRRQRQLTSASPKTAP